MKGDRMRLVTKQKAFTAKGTKKIFEENFIFYQNLIQNFNMQDFILAVKIICNISLLRPDDNK